MSKPKVFIDGQEGTTGLQIHQRLADRDDIELLAIDPDKRKDLTERRRLINEADLVFLCLPDAAAVEAVGLIENSRTRVIDASTAHRTAPGWVYGFPELYKNPRDVIGKARFVANPGCHATGFLSSAAPLVSMRILPRDYPITCFSLTGYSGGGKKMITQYEGAEKEQALYSPRLYGTTLHHKHLPEMKAVAGLACPPNFLPVLGEYMSSGLVPRFPSLIVSGFCMLAALLSFVSGLILDCQRKRARQAFEIQLNVLSLLLRQGRTGMPSGGNRPEQDPQA